MSEKQYGKRGKGNYAQVCVQIPKTLKTKLKVAVAEIDSDMSTFVEEAIEAKLKKDSTDKKE